MASGCKCISTANHSMSALPKAAALNRSIAEHECVANGWDTPRVVILRSDSSDHERSSDGCYSIQLQAHELPLYHTEAPVGHHNRSDEKVQGSIHKQG